MLKMSLYVIILLFSFQISTAIAGKESEVVSPLSMGVNSSLAMENISEYSTSSEPQQQGVFPVICTRLHPGTVMKRQLFSGWGPVFIIGDDPFSLRWMSEHLAMLKSLNALGLVVNVESVDRMDVLQQRADGLLLLPVICDNFVQALQLNAYPVLITEMEISQ
ncbi:MULTISPECIES: integrating conjugative element protein [Escherichia]|uniref:Integrating conjugative element protein n=1 Tax=Escherichia whittamii TaxID=2762229 RepID=A0ABR8TH70_9ESCH|nr:MULTISPECIES: integrating conjugative element protein [Escherichia]QLX43400.1 integrating conjugative element protein [Escherichia coli]MBD7975042.1 integrating conjugative element protein [Escherichia whittamii]MCA4890844.1 integrating conjugative element protein [Escherichia whittamii]MEC9496704.1 integrating conjugative element protein [Escherichia whittamii]MEC9559647.1 integrating conjugative element protein [Escherichia whittamii]